MSLPTVTIIVSDNGASAALQVPQASVQVKIGVAVDGDDYVPVATTNPNTLVSNYTAGPLVEAGGLVCQNGRVCIAVKIPIVTLGAATAVVATTPGSSTSVVTKTLDGTVGAYDQYYVRVKWVTDCTVGVTGGKFQISLDAGRTYGAVLSLGTANLYVIPNTGITINFGAGTLVARDYWSFSTTAPAGDAAGVQSAIAALANSQYGVSGWGSMHIVGVTSAADAASYQTYLESLTTAKYVFSRVLTEARDALAPVAWGGSGETETTWVNSLATAFSATDAKRVCVGGGYYNMPTPYPNQAAGSPRYRRPLTWADAVRRTLVPPQRKGGRVKDGSLSNIVVDPSTDPNDGFIYHDERANPGLDAARFLAAITWPKKPGFYVCHENLMSAPGSQFTELVYGNVIDVACTIGYAAGVNEISDDLRLKASGTLYPTDAMSIQNLIDAALAEGMTNVAMVSDAFSAVDQTANVRTTSNIPIQITVNARGYANSMTETLNLQAG